MRDDVMHTAAHGGRRMPGYRVVIITLDSHAAGPALRAMDKLSLTYPGLSLSIHAAAEWSETPGTSAILHLYDCRFVSFLVMNSASFSS